MIQILLNYYFPSKSFLALEINFKSLSALPSPSIELPRTTGRTPFVTHSRTEKPSRRYFRVRKSVPALHFALSLSRSSHR